MADVADLIVLSITRPVSESPVVDDWEQAAAPWHGTLVLYNLSFFATVQVRTPHSSVVAEGRALTRPAGIDEVRGALFKQCAIEFSDKVATDGIALGASIAPVSADASVTTSRRALAWSVLSAARHGTARRQGGLRDRALRGRMDAIEKRKW